MVNTDRNQHRPGARTLLDYVESHAKSRGAAVAIRHKRLGVWEEMPWCELEREVRHLARGLSAHGFGSGDHLLLLSYPRPEALLLSLAAQRLGGVPVLLDPGQPAPGIARLLENACAEFVFAEAQQQVDAVLGAGIVPTLMLYADARGLAGYGDTAINSAILAYTDLIDAAPAPAVEPEAACAQPSAFMFLQLDAQGEVEHRSLSHADLLQQGQRVVAVEQLTDREQALAARTIAAVGQARYLLAPWLVAGFCLNFPENLATRDTDRRELGPTLVAGTRETYERLAQQVRVRLPEAGSRRRWLVDHALAGDGGLLTRWLGYWLVRRPLRDVIGFTQTRAPLLIGQPLAAGTAALYAALGIDIRHWP